MVWRPAFWFTVRLAMASSVGGALLAEVGLFTVRRKLSLALAEPSLTLTVIKAMPDRPAVGVTVTVRAPALPPKTMALVGTSDGLEEARSKVRLLAAVSASATVNGIAPVEVS